MAILDRLEATLGYAHVSIDVDVNFISFLRALPHTRWGVLGRPRGRPTIFQSGLAAEAWALPRYLPSVIPLDFEEIVKIIFFE